MGDSFSKRLGDLLSDVLETGEIPHTQDFSAGGDVSDSDGASAGRDFSASESSSANADFSANDESSASAESSASTSARKRHPQFNFSQEKSRIAQIIRQGRYTEIPQEVVTAFALLDCPITATPPEVRRAFRKKIKQLHPDAVSQNFENKYLKHEDANAETEKLISANEIIKNWFIQKGI